LEKIFLPTFTAEDIVNLGKYQIYLTLMIDGVGSKPFSATNMPPLKRKPITYRDEVIEFSRATYANPRKEVQAQTEEWHAHVFETVKDKKEREKKEVYLAEKARKEKIIYGDKPAPTEPSKIKIPTEIIEQVKNAESKPAPKKENFAQRPNLSTVKNGTEKNKSLLKDVLSKALQNSPQKSTPVAPIPPKPSVPSTASQGASFEIPKPSTPPPVQEQKIPESKKETPPPQNAYNFSENLRTRDQ
jgi:hypothetical protein